MCQESTELLWLGCLIGLTSVLKIQIRYIGSDKFLIRKKSDCIQKSRDADSYGET